MLFQRFQQLGRKTEITFHKLGSLLRAVDPRKVKNEIRLLAGLVQNLFRSINIKFKDILDRKLGVGPILAVLDVFQSGNKILTHKAFSTCNEYVHKVQSSSSKRYSNPTALSSFSYCFIFSEDSDFMLL